MKLRLTRTLFRNVMDMSDVMKVNAFIIVELPSGERFWAGNGRLRDEFLNQGRIVNDDEVEMKLDRDEDANDGDSDSDVENGIGEEEDAGKSKQHLKTLSRSVENKNAQPAKAVGSTTTTMAIEKKRKAIEVVGESTASAEHSKKRKNLDANGVAAAASSTVSTAAHPQAKPSRNHDQYNESTDMFTLMRFPSNTIWFGKELKHWEKIVSGIRRRAISRHESWHNAHPVVANPDWHLFAHMRHRLANNQPNLKTTAFGFWVNLKPRRVCPKCLCIGGSSGKNDEGVWTMTKKHGEHTCKTDCCGLKRCRFCGHAHEHGSSCVCTCWTDSLKILKIIPGRLSRFNPSKSVADAEKVTAAEPAKKASVTEPEADVQAEDSERDADVQAEDSERDADVQAEDPEMDADVHAEDSEKEAPKSPNEPNPEANGEPEESLWTWKDRDLTDNLQIVSDIMIREAKVDHVPLQDLSAHLALWMENAAAGRYTNFFSHILVNGFCQGCCCFLEVPTGGNDDANAGKSNMHSIADCQQRCCGEFLCKLCLHKHALDDICDCDCLKSAIQALGLEMHDAEKVQESTMAKWETMEGGKAMSFKREVIEQQRLSEISDW